MFIRPNLKKINYLFLFSLFCQFVVLGLFGNLAQKEIDQRLL